MGRLAEVGWGVTGRFVTVAPVPTLPAGAIVDLPGRGKTYVVDTGPPAGRPAAPTLVLLHALACTGLLTWYPSIEALSARYRVITLDQRWHGRGIRSPRFRLEDCADDVPALADVLGIDRFVPVGYSMGSLVAQLVAFRYPQRVDGLVLGASAMRFRRGEAEPLALRVLAHRLRQRSERKLRGGPFGPPAADLTDARRWALAQFRTTSATEIAGATAVIARFDSSGWISRVTAPTAVVVTKRDRAIPMPYQQALVRRLRANAFEVDAGHAAVVLDAARFTPALLAACASVSVRPRAPGRR